jgi:hypothetical protein
MTIGAPPPTVNRYPPLVSVAQLGSHGADRYLTVQQQSSERGDDDGSRVVGLTDYQRQRLGPAHDEGINPLPPLLAHFDLREASDERVHRQFDL